MTKQGSIRPLIWNVSGDALKVFCSCTTFTLPEVLYESLATALKTRNAQGYGSVPQPSLEALVGWFAPDIAFVKREGQRLRFYYLGSPVIRQVTQDLRDAFLLWLSVMALRETDISLEPRLMEALDEQANWSHLDVDSEILRAPNRCIRPKNPVLFDLLTQGVAQHLAGKEVAFGNLSAGQFVLSGDKGSTFSGRELILFPPQSADEPGSGYWTEVVRVSALTSPEANCMRLATSLQVRNYGAVTPEARFSRRRRYLDVFFRARGMANGVIRHGEIPFRLRGPDDAHTRPIYSYPNGQDLFNVLRTFGGSPILDPDKVPFEPVCAENGMWIVPRLGRGHGDTQLPGGQGMSWPERDNFAAILDEHLGSLGIERIEGVSRTAAARGVTALLPWSNPPRPRSEEPSRRASYESARAATQQRRRHLLSRALGGKPLRIALFFLRDEAMSDLAQSLIDLLGEPVERAATLWKYLDGLSIELIVEKSGLLAELLPERPVLSEQEKSRLRRDRWDAVIDDRHERMIQDREAAIVEFLKATLASWGDPRAWIALVEMRESFRHYSNRDPYARVCNLVAQRGGLPQTILIDARGQANEYKMPGALRDGLRMCGIAALDGLRSTRTKIPEQIRWVGLWTIRRNEEDRAFERRSRQFCPLAVLADAGGLRVALPDVGEGGGWRWLPYADAAVRIGQRALPAYPRADQRAQMFPQFYREVLESLLADATETVVMADAVNIRNEVSAFSNQDMCLGDLQLPGLPGSTPLHVRDRASNVSVVRLSADTSKPTSYSRVDAKNFTVGTFQEPGRTRTYWAVRRPPLSMELNPKWKPAMRSPRRPMSSDASDFSEVDSDLIGADRLAPVLEELVIMVRSVQMDFDLLAGLMRKLRPAHVSWSGETVLPYPLHEASRLERHLK